MRHSHYKSLHAVEFGNLTNKNLTTSLPHLSRSGLKHAGAPGRFKVWRPWQDNNLKTLEIDSLYFFLLGKGWKKFRSFEPKLHEPFGEILLRVSDYSTDVIVPLIDWRPGSSPTGSSLNPTLFLSLEWCFVFDWMLINFFNLRNWNFYFLCSSLVTKKSKPSSDWRVHKILLNYPCLRKYTLRDLYAQLHVAINYCIFWWNEFHVSLRYFF
jgi:hypothetical protein